MKIFHYKYKAKLYYKQPTLFHYCFAPLICMSFFLLLLCTDKFLALVSTTYKVHFSFYLILFVVFILIVLVIWTISPLSWSKIIKTKHKLLKIIESNHFFYETNKKIKYSMTIKYYWLNDLLYLEVYPSGGIYSEKINDLTKQFETSFNLITISIQDDYADHTTYILTNFNNNFINSTRMWDD